MTGETHTYLIYGVSRGLGKAILKFLPEQADRVIGVSRTRPAYPEATRGDNIWIQADLSRPREAARIIQEAVGNEKIDYLIYNVGIWEKTGFTAEYDFEKQEDSEIQKMISTNITSAILSVKSLLPNIRLSKNGKIIFIGSTLGLQNHNKKEVVFSATKFAIQGIIHALRTHARIDHIGVSVIHLGDMATQYEYEAGTAIVTEKHKGTLIPLGDVLDALRFITRSSNAACIKEITMPSMQDPDI